MPNAATTCLAVATLLASTGIASAKTLVLEDYFRRPAIATGTFKNAIDGSVRGIKVRFRGQWDRTSATLTLAEDIAYSDGEKERKVWRLRKTGPGDYVGTRADIVGTAKGFTDAQGRVHLQYRAVVGSRTLSFDDVLELQPDGNVLNTASVSYFIFHVGDVELHFRRSGR